MSSDRDGYLLFTLPGVTVRSRRTPTSTQTGTLALECITVSPEVKAALNRDVFLILRINSQEIPIDPRRSITLTSAITGAVSSDGGGGRTYILNATETDPEELELIVAGTGYGNEKQDSQLLEDLDTFEGILAEYADFRNLSATYPSQSAAPLKDAPQDLRGHLVLVNEDSGEIVGEVDQKISVHEDAALMHPEKGHESDPVVIEIAEDESGEGRAIDVFARTVPADQSNWMTSSAKLVSQGITQGTNLLVNVISSASSYYIAHSQPSTSSSASTSSASGSTSKSPAQSKPLAFISSHKTQTGLTHAHAFSAQAVKVSGKTLEVIDGMISSLIGGKSAAKSSARTSSKAATINSSNLAPPPPYTSSPVSLTNEKPGLPPRSGSTLEKPSLPPRSRSTSPGPSAPPLPPRSLTTKAKLILSADLILSTIEESTKQIIDAGGRSATGVVGHRYGTGAAQSTALMAGTARNVALVYIDMRGVGRKALLKRVAKKYAKSKMSSSK